MHAERNPGADAAGASPVPVQMWQSGDLVEALPVLCASGGEETRSLQANRIRCGRQGRAWRVQAERQRLTLTGPRNSGRMGENKIVPTAWSSTSRFSVSSGVDTYMRKNLRVH
jgi:hypothetical protein